VTGLSRAALACLEAHDWPGNVRDLENAIERAVVLGSTDLILPEDLPETVLEAGQEGAGPIGGYHDSIRNEKMRAILAALEQAGGSFTEAAKLLGIHPNYLHRLVRNLDLRGAVRSLPAASGAETRTRLLGCPVRTGAPLPVDSFLASHPQVWAGTRGRRADTAPQDSFLASHPRIRAGALGRRAGRTGSGAPGQN